MMRWGCISFILGGLIGVVLAVLVPWLVFATAGDEARTPPVADTRAPSADVEAFVSEQFITSQVLKEMAADPTEGFELRRIDIQENNQIAVDATVDLAALDEQNTSGDSFIVGFTAGVLLRYVSQTSLEIAAEFRWLEFGFITIPASAFAGSELEEVVEPQVVVDQQMLDDLTDSDIEFAGFYTTDDGLVIQFNYIGAQ